MPDCLILGSLQQTDAWLMRIEDLGESWRALPCAEADAALERLHRQHVLLAILCPGQQSNLVLNSLQERPPLCPPWLFADCPWADAALRLEHVSALPAWLEEQRAAGSLPRMALLSHARLLCIARSLMSTLNIPMHLRAWDFLPDMAALVTVHPPLAEDLRGRLYPLTARRHGLTPAAVERRLRLAIESTWEHARLPALERFFGHSVDPERGKPTNREFLYQVQQRLMLAGRRMV